MATSKDSLQVERAMIDYILANLEHEPECEVHRWAALDNPPCTCRRAKAERWLRDREAFVEAFRAARGADAETLPLRELEEVDAELLAAYARLEGE